MRQCTKVKICGITRAADAVAAVDAGAQMIGLHFCDSRRRLAVADAQLIASEVAGHAEVVGVFIDPSLDEVQQVMARVPLQLLQLHGNEAPTEQWPLPVMKTLHVRDGVIPDPSPWPDPVLVDTWTATGRGGSGQSWDHELARDLIARRRVMIAGGLGPDSVGTVVRRFSPYGVDVSSGVESAPGIKDAELMRRFVAGARGGFD